MGPGGAFVDRRSQEVGEGGTIPNGTLLLLFDLFHAVLFPERHWQEPRSQEVGEKREPYLTCTLLLLFDFFHAELFAERHRRGRIH